MNTYSRPAVSTEKTKLEPFEVKDMMIIKQAILKSLIEAGAVKECTPQSKKLVYDWAAFIYMNSYEEWRAAHPTAHKNPDAVPF